MAKTILYADDSASMRKFVSLSLKESGYDVVAAVDGKDALDKLKSEKIDMVVTDLNMPNMDGIQLIKEIRKSLDHRLTPIVMLTTEAQKAIKQEGKAAGASGWMVKPITPEKFLEAIKSFIR